MVTRNIFLRTSILAWVAVLLPVAGAHRIGMAQVGGAQLGATPASSSSRSSGEPSSQSTKRAAATPQASPTGENAAAPGADTGDVPKIRVGINEVNVVFTVTDKHGKRVTDLKQNDFRIVDDSKPATEIRSFHAETNLPLQVGLLIDASSSVRDRFKFEQESAIEFLNQTVRKRYDQAFVVGFDVTPEVTQDFTDDTEKLAHGVRELRPGGGTALYDALYYACRDKLLKEPQIGPTRRAIILLSDGEDNQSHVTREEVDRNGAARGGHHLHHQHERERHQGSGRQGARTHGRRHRRPRIFSLPDSRRDRTPSPKFRMSCAASMTFPISRRTSSRTGTSARLRSWPLTARTSG